jgi:basic amino acid/polyamine antiporter, APA family
MYIAGVRQEQTVVRRLLRSLSLVDLSVLASSSMAPAYSIAAVMGLVVAAAGVGAPLAVIVSTIPITFVAIGFMRLSMAKPSAGGAYTWSRTAFGDRVGWFTAVLVIIAYYFGTLASAVPAGVYTINALSLLQVHVAATPLSIAIAGVLWTIFSTYFLIIGARPTALISAVFLAIEIAALLIIAAIAMLHPFVGSPSPTHLPIGITIGATGIAGLIVGAVLSIWLSAGWEIATYSSEESTGASTTPGAGALIGLLTTMALVWFCMVAFMHVGTVDGFTHHQDDALAYVAQRLGGGWIAGLMVANVLVSSAAALWTTMLVLSRAVFAMGRDGLLPRVLAGVHPKYGSPWVSILTVSIPVALLLLYSGFVSSAQQTLNTVVTGSSIFVGSTFIITGLACACLHTRQQPEQRHGFTGVVLPAIGALWTLGFLIYDIWTQQPAFIQWATVAGIAIAFIFALLAGRWVTSYQPKTLPMKEEA